MTREEEQKMIEAILISIGLEALDLPGPPEILAQDVAVSGR
jgi:hypothetical protein